MIRSMGNKFEKGKIFFFFFIAATRANYCRVIPYKSRHLGGKEMLGIEEIFCFYNTNNTRK